MAAAQAASSDGPLGVALLGYGLAGETFHAPLLRTTAGLRVAAVVTGNAERAERAAHHHPGARVVAHADELWADPRGLDLVVVATPNRTHTRLATDALRAGLPVVVDKPVATELADAVGLRDLATRLGLSLSVFHNRRWDDDARTLSQLLAAGELGGVHRLESRFERWRAQPRADSWRESADPADGGGVLMDLGSHLVDQALHWFGPVATVRAEVRVLRSGARADDDAFVALDHVSGTTSHLWASAVAAAPGPRLRALGRDAAFVSWGMDAQEAALRSGREPGTRGWGERAGASGGELHRDGRVHPCPLVPGSYGTFYAELAASLRMGGPPPVTIAEAIDVLAVLGAARRSAAEDGAPVSPQ